MDSDSFKTITDRGEGLYKEKGSKFIAIAFPVDSEEDVKQKLSEVRKQYFDARHHCYAYVLGADKSQFRANDDGEPSGSAGKPILNQIYSFELTNVLVVVVRYFGGVKLGVSGLVTAYKVAAREALTNAPSEFKTVDEFLGISFTYPLMNEVMRIMKEENLQQMNQKFEIECYFEIKCRKNDIKRIAEKLVNIYGVTVNYLGIP
ncbi:MAG: YigZ family protein [Bacteroidales bacterium]|nr:YigZ family protein [Bacteroidales bacterium]